MSMNTSSNQANSHCNWEKFYYTAPCTFMNKHYLSQTPTLIAHSLLAFPRYSRLHMIIWPLSASCFEKWLHRFDVLGVHNTTALYLNAINFSGGRGAITLVQCNSV